MYCPIPKVFCSLTSLVMFLMKAEPLDKFFRDYFGVGTFRCAKKHIFLFFSG